MEQQDKKISQMTQLTNISGDESVPVVRSGGNYRVLVNQIVALARQTMVAAETGKGLSANDFTDAFKAKLEGLSNYDDAEVRSLITAVNGRLDTILGDGASSAIDTFNEIEAFLTGITDTQTLTGLLAEQKQTITAETDDKLAGKVDKVSGKGLSANDYTDEDKAKLGALLGNEQFGYTGHYGMDGKFYTAPNYANSGLIPVNRKFDIEFATNVGGGVASVAFFDGAKRFISAIQVPQTLAAQVLPAADIPEDAVFFIISTATPAKSYYRNGETIESREGAMAEAMASLGRDKLDKEKWDAEHEQFTIKGYFLGKTGVVSKTSSDVSGITPLLPLSKTFPIVLKNVRAYNNAVAVGFYDATGAFISYPEGIENLNGDFTVSADKYPASACYFIACSEKAGSTYTNGPTQEAREGAVSEAIQAAMTAAVDESLIAEAKINGAVFNRATGFFELNGLTDITAEQMRTILNFGRFRFTEPKSGARSKNTEIKDLIRTNILVSSADELRSSSTADGLCYNQSEMEVLAVGIPSQNDQTYVFSPKSIFSILTRCYKLHTIIGDIRLDKLGIANELAFVSCTALRNVRLRDIVKSLDISGAPLLSFDSVACMVDNASNTSAITVTVHPTVYGKLTDEQADIMALLPENLAKDAQNDNWETVNVNMFGNIFIEPNIANMRLRAGDNITIAANLKNLSGRRLALAVSFRFETGAPKDLYSNFIESGESRLILNATIPPNTKAITVYIFAPDSTSDSDYQQEEYKGLKISVGEHTELPYTAPLSSITDDATREKAEWLSLMQIAEARQINFVTTE